MKEKKSATANENESPWKGWQKFGCRFLFVFLGLTSIFCSINNLYSNLFDGDFEKLYRFLNVFSGLFYWLDRHFYRHFVFACALRKKFIPGVFLRSSGYHPS